MHCSDALGRPCNRFCPLRFLGPESVRQIEAAPPPPFLALSTAAAVNDRCFFYTFGNMLPTYFLPGVGMQEATAIVLVRGIRDFRASLCTVFRDRKGGAVAAARRLHYVVHDHDSHVAARNMALL